MDSQLDRSIAAQPRVQPSSSLNLVALTQGQDDVDSPSTKPSQAEAGQQLVMKPLDYGSDAINSMTAAEANRDIQAGFADLFKGFNDVSVGGIDVATGDAKDGAPLISSGENEIRTGANDLVDGLTGLIDSQAGPHGSSDSTAPKSTASPSSDSTPPKSTASPSSDSTAPKSTTSPTSDSTAPKSTVSSPTSDSTAPKSTVSSTTTSESTPSTDKGTLKANAGLPVVSTENAAVAKADPLGQAPSESAIQSFVNKAGDLDVQVKPGDLYVNKNGADGAYTTIQAAVNAAKAGQTIVVADGTYDEDVKLKQSVTLLGQAGATIDGSGKSSCIDATNVSNVTIEGLTLENANNPLQSGELQITGGSNWLVENNVMKDSNAAGIASKGTDNLSVIGNKMDDNGQEGYVLGKSSNLLFADNQVSGNNTHDINSGWEAGGGKFVETQGAVIENNIVTDNNGPGLWSDVSCNDSLIKNNFVSDNNGAGIFYEISTNGTIENNTVTNNSQSYHTWGWGAGIEISASSGTKVENNLLVNNGNGIAFIQQNRGSSTDVHGDDASGNTVIGGAAPLGWYSDYDKTIWSSGNTAENNNIYGDKIAWSSGDESVAALKGTPVAKETVLSQAAAQAIVKDDGIDDTV